MKRNYKLISDILQFYKCYTHRYTYKTNDIFQKCIAMRTFITSQSFPIVIKNILNWDCFNWDILKWQEMCHGDAELEFRIGRNVFSKSPQYENLTPVKHGTFQNLLDYNESQEMWAYFDYKYLNTWLTTKQAIREDICWENLGFPEKGANDSTIWIGTKGSHTNCHIDTYGINIVAQVYGRKQWILFPPEEDLKASRIPYEESTIFSKLNLFCPKVEDFKQVTRAYSVTLNPGEVLIVPNGWWHYVENLDFAISINIWIEHENDYINHCREATVQLLVSQLTKGLSELDQRSLLTPSNKHIPIHNVQDLMDTIKRYSNPALKADKPKDRHAAHELPIHGEYFNISELSSSDLRSLLLEKYNRFNISDDINIEDSNATVPVMQHIVDYITNPTVVNPLTENLIKELWSK